MSYGELVESFNSCRHTQEGFLSLSRSDISCFLALIPFTFHWIIESNIPVNWGELSVYMLWFKIEGAPWRVDITVSMLKRSADSNVLGPWHFIRDGEPGVIAVLGGHRRTMLSVCLVRYGIAVLDLCVGVVVLSVEPAVASSPGPFSALGLSLRSCLLPSWLCLQHWGCFSVQPRNHPESDRPSVLRLCLERTQIELLKQPNIYTPKFSIW